MHILLLADSVLSTSWSLRLTTVRALCYDNTVLPAGSRAESPVKPASSPAKGVSSPVLLHQAGPQLASYRLDTLDSGGSSWSSTHLVCPVSC